MAPRVIIFGSRGYLGQQFLSVFPQAECPTLDIADRSAVAAVLDSRPEIVINCAGKTGRPNVDWCETHRAETLRANVTGALVVMEEALQRDLYLVHLGSGCIYAGDNQGQGFRESDVPNFGGSFYSRTKAWADQILAEMPVLNLRLRMPFDGTTGERNLITKLRKYSRVLTEQNSLTCLPDLLRTAAALIARRVVGTFNIVNPGTMSPYEIMERYRELVDPRHTFEPLPTVKLGEVASAGRSNCLLNTEKLGALGLRLPDVHQAIDTCLLQMAQSASMTSRAA